MKEVLNILIKVASVKCEISTDSNRMNKHDVSDIYGDYSEVSRDTGWTPSYSIESSLENLLDGWRERLKNG